MVITAGVPVGIPGTTNMIRVHLVGGALFTAVGVGRGKASGPLCVCRTPEEVAEKARPGCVLVVPFTSEESGANSHAATVGLALDKPVIVGAGGATRILTDGMQVSVDCAHGTVQRLPG